MNYSTENQRYSIKYELSTHHKPREDETFIYVRRSNNNKSSRDDRRYFFDSYSVREIEKIAGRLGITDCEFCATAAEYLFDFTKLGERKVTRVRNGKVYEEIRRQDPRREKWIEAIQLNFLILDLTKLELEEIPTLEEVNEAIYERCHNFNIPKPIIVDTGDNGTKFELRWVWSNAMKNCGDRNNPKIKYPIFNSKFDEMQTVLSDMFCDFGVDRRQLKATAWLRIVGTPNNKTGIISSVVGEADEILTYQEFRRRLGIESKISINFTNQDKPTRRRGYMELKPIKTASVVAPNEELQLTFETDEFLCNAKKEEDAKIVEPKFEQIVEPEKTDNKSDLAEQRISKSENDLAKDDLSRLHHDSDYWVCLCTESKCNGLSGKWTEHWTPAKRVNELLATLKLKFHGLDEYNVYVSQLEFLKPQRRVDNVAAFNVCFVDVDGKIANHGDYTAEDWKNLILEHCQKNNIPIPSEIVFSGNGAHVKYFFKHRMPQSEFQRWSYLEKNLYELFKEIGADSKATDGARVLRVEGTMNCKPDTKDRDVRVIFSGDDYNYEKFAQEIEELSGMFSGSIITVSPNKTSKAQAQTNDLAKSVKSSKPDASVKAAVENTEVLKKSEKAPQSYDVTVMTDVDDEDCEEYDEGCQNWVFLRNVTTGEEQFIPKSDFENFVSQQDKNHRLERSHVEYFQKKRVDRGIGIRNFNLSYVVLTRCPGQTLEEQLENISKHCLSYRERGIPEPNKILQDGEKLILLWLYSNETIGQKLPGIAIKRWRTTQEFLSHYFEDWGARENGFGQKSTALLPIAGYASVKVVQDIPTNEYLFDKLATDTLPFTQDEVREYKKDKKLSPSKTIELEELTAEYVLRRESLGQESQFRQALKMFNDIVRLLRLRGEKREGIVPQGSRELCVFYALNYAVRAGLIKAGNEYDFDNLAQRLIDKCGGAFSDECTPKTFMTLKKRFLDGAEEYRPRKETLLKTLCITTSEQEKLDILKLKPEKELKKREKREPWKVYGVSRSTFYRHRKEAKEIGYPCEFLIVDIVDAEKWDAD